MKWIIDSFIGTIKSIGSASLGGARDVQYFLITFEEYNNIHFKIFRNTAARYGIHEGSALEAFNQQNLDSLIGRRAVVRIRQEKLGKNDWYIVEDFKLLK